MTGPEQYGGDARPDEREGYEGRYDGGYEARERRRERPAPRPARRDDERYDEDHGDAGRYGNGVRERDPRAAVRARAGTPGTPAERGAARRPRGPLLRESTPPYQRRGGIAAVLLYRNGGHRIVWPDRNEDVNKPLFGSPYTVFEVQLGTHVTELRLDLPAAGDGVFFQAVAKVHWVVTDPHLVVQEQVWDVAELLHDELLDGLRRLSRRFRITEAQRADEAVRDELASGRLSLGRDIGLRTRVYVFVDLDASVKAEVSRRDTLGLTMEADQRIAEAERRRDAAERALVADRAREMEELFRRGDLAQIAHRMVMHPDKQGDIRSRLQRERQDGREDYLAVFNRLLDTGVLERHDIGEQTYQVLMYLRTRTGTGTVTGGSADRVVDPAGATGRRLALEGALPEPDRPDRDGEERRAPRPEHGGAPHDPRVYEPTRVESGSERDRDRERDRERDGDRDRDGARGGGGRRDGHRDPYEREDAYDRAETYDRYDRADPYDRGGRGRTGGGSARSGRASTDFDDWDDA
ncbi:hypothetical protein [Streptomyces sp. NPDC003327]